MEELVKYKILKVNHETGEEFTGLDEIAFTSDPAIITKGLAFSAVKRMHFNDKPKMRIVAPAMIPMDIYRNQDGEEFEVTFTAEQIEEIHKELMLKTKDGNLFNFEHDKSSKVPAYILEAWIVDNPKEDKAWSSYGIYVPKGTLMLTTQITDEKYYNELVKNDQIGYSIGGSFGLKLSKQTNTNNMSLPAENLTEGKQYIFKNGKLEEVDAKFSEETTDEKADEVVEEVKEEMASEEATEEVKEEVAEEVSTELAEEQAPADALTEEKVSQMIDAKVGEVLNMLAELKATIEEAKNDDIEEEEEQAPVQLSAYEKLAKFAKQLKNK